MALDLYCPPVNNTGIDPFQGFDFEVWAQDSCEGKIAWFGRFQSLTLSIRNATETYLELGQRVPIYLDGEIQIAWVLEQGMVDMAFVMRTFGLRRIARDQVITRGPRFQISFDSNANELESSFANSPSKKYRMGSRQLSPFDRYGASQSGNIANIAANSAPSAPQVQGRYELQRCKVDSVSLGIMPGRRVAAVRWEGVAEGITYVPQSLQSFKNQTGNPNFERYLSAAEAAAAPANFVPPGAFSGRG